MDDMVTSIGIDAGGTHTDAVLCTPDGIAGRAKVATDHENLPRCIEAVLTALAADAGREALGAASRVTLGTTLLVNAQVQGRLDRVGLALSSGPGLSPARFSMGDSVCIVPGGLDHRGEEVSRLDTAPLKEAACEWKKAGIRAFACVGKFSPRNPAHELAMADTLEKAGCTGATLGHRISGELNFPRRIATAWYNAAASRLHGQFLDAVSGVLTGAGIHAPVFLLKADGGALPVAASRQRPVQSILSGPAASVMGALALAKDLESGCALLLDIGGTTTDIALFVEDSPVVDREGMKLGGRRTLVRSLATLSVGIGGYSQISIEGNGASAVVTVGPLRRGPAMAFGGACPTLLDALNVLNADGLDTLAGDHAASLQGIQHLAAEHGLEAHRCAELVWNAAADGIRTAADELVSRINSRPIYTLRELKSHEDVKADRVLLVGGPTYCLCHRLSSSLGLPVEPLAEADVANAVGAALTRPTASLSVYADTGRRSLLAPSLGIKEPLQRGATLSSVQQRAQELLAADLESQGIGGLPLEITEADLFAVLGDSGAGARDIRVTCQAVPGIIRRVRS